MPCCGCEQRKAIGFFSALVSWNRTIFRPSSADENQERAGKEAAKPEIVPPEESIGLDIAEG